MPSADPRAELVAHYRTIESLLPATWAEGTVLANGIHQHYYRTGGDKPPLVLLHGFLEGALSWLRLARILAADYDVIMPDARGHGLSERITTGFLEHLPADAADLIRTLAPAGAHVLGFSQGGSTAIWVAERHPELVRSLIVTGWADPGDVPANSASLTQNEGYQAWYRSYLAWLEGLKTQTPAERLIASLSQAQGRLGATLLPEEEYVPWVEDSARLDLNLVRQSMGMWEGAAERARQLAEALARVRCPVLLVKSGRWPTPGAVVSLQEEPSDQPNVRIVRFVNAGHLVHREQFDQFLALAQSFLKA